MNLIKWHGLDVDPMKISESIITKPQISQVDTAFNESTNESGITVLYPKIEAIHEGRTRNFNRYLADKLKGDPDLRSGVYSWTAPYPKPVIYNHDTSTEATGRVYSASYSEYTSAGRPGIIAVPKITQEKAIKDILEGRLLTVSIGASTNAAVCSICGTDIINEGFCGHMRGEEYDGAVAEWVAGDLFFDELSWVNVPADSDAMITSTGLTSNMMTTGESKESIERDKIIVGTIQANKLVPPSLALTTEEGVVKSVSETTEKEEDKVTDEPIVGATTEDDEQQVVTNNEEQTQETKATDEPVAETPKSTNQEETTDDKSTTDEPVVTESDDLSDELKQVQEELTDAQATIAELTSANEELAKDLQESYVHFLVDLRMAIGKESDREAAVNKFATRTVESIKDSISDILAEKPSINTTTTRTVENVVKPTGDVVNKSKTLATESVKVISNEDALKNLLMGRN